MPKPGSTSGEGLLRMATPETHKPAEEDLAYEQELLVGSVTDVLNALVHALGLSQKELARRLGVTEGRVSQILSGSRGLTLNTLAAVGSATGVRFDLLPRPVGNHGKQELEHLDWLTRLREIVHAEASNLPESGSGEQRANRVMPQNERHVVPSRHGGWHVRAPGAGRPSGHFDRQSDAIRRAREIVSKAGGGEVVIHSRDGQIRSSDAISGSAGETHVKNAARRRGKGHR